MSLEDIEFIRENQNWDCKLIKEVADVYIGRTPPRKEPEWFSKDHGIKWVSIKDLGDCDLHIENTSEYLVPEAISKFNFQIAPKNTILLSFKLTVGRVAITSEEMVTNEAIAQFIIKNKSVLSNLYLYYYLKNFNYNSLGSTSSIAKAIKSKMVKEIPILLPPIEIQNQIAKILYELDSKIENLRKINHNLEKISSRLYSNLIYDEKDLEFIELKEICKFIKGRKPTEISEQYKSDFEDYLTIEVLSNQNQVYAFDDKGIKAKEKDILMVMDGASSGKLIKRKKGLLGSTLAKIDVKEDYIELVYQFLKINEKYITENTTGSAIPHTDKGLVLSLRLPISEKLTEYSDKLKNIRLAIISNNNEIMKLQHLRDILLPKLMSGEIDVSKINCDLD